MTDFPDPNFPFLVEIEDDQSITLNWDETHPVTSIFNEWTADDFTDFLTKIAKKVLMESDEITEDCDRME